MNSIFAILTLLLTSSNVLAQQERAMIQDGIYEYPVVAIATEAGNNKVNVHHEPIYFIINQQNHRMQHQVKTYGCVCVLANHSSGDTLTQ
jgi:succinylarginine dihydrolase